MRTLFVTGRHNRNRGGASEQRVKGLCASGRVWPQIEYLRLLRLHIVVADWIGLEVGAGQDDEGSHGEVTVCLLGDGRLRVGDGLWGEWLVCGCGCGCVV